MVSDLRKSADVPPRPQSSPGRLHHTLWAEVPQTDEAYSDGWTHRPVRQIRMRACSGEMP
jgi:hypothetical protein